MSTFLKAERVVATALGLLLREITLPAYVWRDAVGDFAGFVLYFFFAVVFFAAVFLAGLRFTVAFAIISPLDPNCRNYGRPTIRGSSVTWLTAGSSGAAAQEGEKQRLATIGDSVDKDAERLRSPRTTRCECLPRDMAHAQ